VLNPQPMLAVRVLERREAAIDVLSFVLVAADGGSLPPCSAGAHIDITLPNGMMRQYSLCKADSARGAYELAILRDPDGRGGSACAHRDIHVGDTLTISHPRNLFPLVPATDSVLFAGGIGITPILAMAEALHDEGRAFEMHYCTRSPERAAYREYLAQAAYSGHVHFYNDSAPQEGRCDVAAILGRLTDDVHLYVCGPEGFIRHVCDEARRLGWCDNRIHFEHFSASAAPAGGNAGFELVLARRGIRIPVGPHQTAAQALLDHGVDIPLSCEQGVCGSCLLPVLEGIPEHRDVFLSAAERDGNRCFTPCCSRARTPSLLIDL
jgi:vanillate monooxygenase ferredoxin subunit